MRRTRHALLAATLAVGGLTLPALAAADTPAAAAESGVARWRPDLGGLRVATYNVSLNRPEAGQLIEDLRGGDDPQARDLAQVIQTVRPDVILLNELDHDEAADDDRSDAPTGRWDDRGADEDEDGRETPSEALHLFVEEYLRVGQRGEQPISYPYSFTAPVNTGVPSGHDLDNDGVVGGPGDAFGFGDFPGQYGMAVLSRYPIGTEDVRTFQGFLWKDMPGALLPDDRTTPEPADWYTEDELEDVRLSSKSHWDVPVRVRGTTVHVLASHPTPPTFDGPEDRNGRRNHDEIRFWADYVSPRDARYIYDDDGERGGLRPNARFVIAGDLNADPVDGDSVPGAAGQLLDHPRVRDPRPTSTGAVEADAEQPGANRFHDGDPALDTADFAEPPGNLRVDYVLPSRNVPVRGSGVFWPAADEPGSELTGVSPFPTSDHRLVWADLQLPARR